MKVRIDRLRTRFILPFLALTCALFWSSCGNPQSSTNSVPPRVIQPTPTDSREAENTNASVEPETSASDKSTDERFCKDDNPSGTRQKCIFPLDGYEEAEYEYKDSEALTSYISRVVGYIEESLYSKNCEIVAITAWGFADNLNLEKKLKWQDVPEVCRTPETCGKGDLVAEHLTNNDLACVRECLVKDRIYSRLEKNIDIVSKDWNSEHRYYDEVWEVGPQYRKVEIILERGGECPDD